MKNAALDEDVGVGYEAVEAGGDGVDVVLGAELAVREGGILAGGGEREGGGEGGGGGGEEV